MRLIHLLLTFYSTYAAATTIYYDDDGCYEYTFIEITDRNMIMEWISVDDKLPIDDGDVLVYHWDDFHITVGSFEAHNVSFYIESDGSKFYTDDGWDTEISWAQKGRVTHWMPLPSPPKENP